VAKSKLSLLTVLTNTPLGSPWIMQFDRRKQVPMLDWLKENHPETRALFP
jgi:hypothetical protein